MFGIGTPELFVILLIALIVVGPQRMPELARTVGKALREFRKVQDDVKGMVNFELDEDERPKTTAPRPGMAGAGGRADPRVGPAARQAGGASEAPPAPAEGAPAEDAPAAEVPPAISSNGDEPLER